MCQLKGKPILLHLLLFCRSNIGTNDVAGNYSLTLVDVLDTLAIMGDQEGFEEAVKTVIEWVQFDVNTKPQVFEVTIRVLGGLLSAHTVGPASFPHDMLADCST